MDGWSAVSSNELPTCGVDSAVDVFVCIDDPSYPEGYTRLLGYWVNQMVLFPEGADDSEAGKVVTGFYTSEDNLLTPVDNVVYWQYLPEPPDKPASS